MRRSFVLLGLLAVLAIPATALAVDLQSSHVGTTCEHGGTFHFVANGVDGGVGRLPRVLGWRVGRRPGAGYTNQGTNHWTIDAIGTLQSASATVGKKLVLSDSMRRRRVTTRSSRQPRLSSLDREGPSGPSRVVHDLDGQIAERLEHDVREHEHVLGGRVVPVGIGDDAHACRVCRPDPAR